MKIEEIEKALGLFESRARAHKGIEAIDSCSGMDVLLRIIEQYKIGTNMPEFETLRQNAKDVLNKRVAEIEDKIKDI